MVNNVTDSSGRPFGALTISTLEIDDPVIVGRRIPPSSFSLVAESTITIFGASVNPEAISETSTTTQTG